MTAQTGMPWLTEEGPQPAIVLSSRVRLARNVADIRFRESNNAEEREEVIRLTDTARVGVAALEGASWHHLDQLSALSRRWLHERQLASLDLIAPKADGNIPPGGAILAGEGSALICNEEDHLRIQAFAPGFALDRAHAAAGEIEAHLGRQICFAFHPEFGYLTGCPTNVGTGLRASVLIHLPALVLTKEVGKVLRGVAQIGLTHRGLWGEGSEVRGGLFQLSNQTTLGRSETDLVDHLGHLVVEIMGHEARARDVLRLEAIAMLEDRVWRAWAVLRNARLLGFDEAIELLGDLRLGVGMGILPRVGWTTMNRLLIEAQDAHLALAAETSLEDEALPALRADTVRQALDEEVRG
jgi:protein arginine kinase